MRAGKIDPELDAKIRADVAELATRFDARKDLSRETATVLFFRYGLYPSVQLVYGYTRKGSLTDVSKDLEDFWRNIREKARVQIEGVPLPEDVLAKTGEVLSSLWAFAMEKASASLADHRAEAADKVEQARLAAEQAETRMQEALARADQAKAEAAEAHTMREEAERVQAIEHAEKLAALERVADAEARAAAATQARVRSEEQFSVDLEAERQARKQSEERLDGELRFAKTQIEEARQVGRVLKERLTAVEADRNLVETQLRRQLSSQLEELGGLRLEVGEMRGRNAVLVEERERLALRVDELLARLEQNSTARATRLKEQIREGLRAQLVTKAAAFELAELLEVELLFDSQGGEDVPERLFLGVVAPGGVCAITPAFSTLDELEEFCAENLDRYDGIDAADIESHEKWFWDTKA